MTIIISNGALEEKKRQAQSLKEKAMLWRLIKIAYQETGRTAHQMEQCEQTPIADDHMMLYDFARRKLHELEAEL